MQMALLSAVMGDGQHFTGDAAHEYDFQGWICAHRLPMIHQNSLRFYNDIAYDDYNGLVLDDNEGRHLAGTASLCSLIFGWQLARISFS